MNSSGWRVQATVPASAIEAPISFRNPRRPTGSSHSEACAGNSRLTKSPNASVSASSSRLCQYRRPAASLARALIEARSSLLSALMWIRADPGLPVARGAGGQRLYLVFLHETTTELHLIGRR